MIDFQPEDRTQQRLVGGIATLIYAVSVLLLLLLLKFQLLPPPDNGEGLMINFGNVEEAAPGAGLAMNDQAAEAPQQPPVKPGYPVIREGEAVARPHVEETKAKE